jgi:hypothetical protein
MNAPYHAPDPLAKRSRASASNFSTPTGSKYSQTFEERLKKRFGLTLPQLSRVPEPVRSDIARAVPATTMLALAISADDVAAAIRHQIPLALASMARSVWNQGRISEDFPSLESYLVYRAAKHRAEAERRALKRAIETNPFTIPGAIATARAFGAAIDALPVGKDIRARLHARLEAHVATLEALVPREEPGR